MPARGPMHLRKATNVVLDALLHAVEQAARGQPISMHLLETTVASLKGSVAFDDFYHRSYREMMEIVEDEKQEQRRTNGFGRLMLHPLSPLLEDGSLDRQLVPNVMTFLHMALGDEMEAHSARCRDIVEALRSDLGDHFTWDVFYDDPEAKLVQWRVLVAVAALFKRYDVRKDWFLKLMQNRLTSVSVASNAFVTREHAPGDEPVVFGDKEFCLFFQALFSPLDALSPRDGAAFRGEFGKDPHDLIGPFLDNLATCAVD